MNAYVFLEILFVIVIGWMYCRTDKNGTVLDKFNTGTLRGIAILGITMHHMAQYLEEQNKLMIVFLWTGYLFTGIFLFISGYGNLFSYKKVENQSFKQKLIWLINRISRVLISYLIFLCISVCTENFMLKNDISIGTVLKDLYTISLPGWLNWYIKIQLLLYTIFFVVYNIKAKIVFKQILLAIVVMVYVFSLKMLGISGYWWNTALCFSLGVILSENKEAFFKKYNDHRILISVFVSCTFLCSFILEQRVNNIFGVVSSASFVLLIAVINEQRGFRNKLLNAVGNVSLEVYFTHLIMIKILLIDNYASISNNIAVPFIFLTAIIVPFIMYKIVDTIQKICMGGVRKAVFH